MRKEDPEMIRSCGRAGEPSIFIKRMSSWLSHITASLQAVRDTMKVVIIDTTWIRSGLFFSVALDTKQQWGD